MEAPITVTPKKRKKRKSRKKPVRSDKLNIRLVGFMYSDSLTDQTAKYMYDQLPNSNVDEQLPIYWSYHSQGFFLHKYSHLGTVVWSRRHNYHLLIVNGVQVLRAWTDRKFCITEVNSSIMNVISGKIVGLNACLTKYFAGNVSVRTMDEAKLIMDAVKQVYGV